MRFIRTTNSQIEFIEANDNGQILNSIGLQLGEVYFQIKNGKVAFYLNDSEKPFDNFIWSTNIPLTIDDEVYETEDEVSEALHSIMNDSFQEQLDQLKEDLAAEEARAQEAEAQLDDKIDDETSRAVSAETHLQDEVTALSGTVATFDERITRNTNDISALTNTVNAEIARSTNKDGEHDAAISGLTNSLNNEISRATSAETSLYNEILAETNRAQVAESGITANLNIEIQNRIADVDAEEARALAAESGITANLNAEISRATTRENAIDDKVDSEIARSTAKDASHDAEISGLSTSLQNEINRAVGAENSLRNDLNAEIANRASGDTLLQSNIDAEEARALAAESALTDALNAEVSRSTAKDASQDALISGLTTSLNAEISRATGVENGLRTDLNAEIQNRINAVSGLTERVADDEASTGSALVDLNNKINALSGENASQTIQISGLNTSLNTEISRATGVENAIRNDLTNETSARTTADAAQLQRITALEVGKADASNVYTKAESDAKYATKDYISGLTDNFYTKGQTNELLAAKADKVSAVASAIYNSTNKTIDFKNISGTVISSVDARDFIKDGMVDNVSISGSNLVITFNTDAGKEPISIPLSQIFDPSNYYTKSEINAYSASVETALNSKASQSDLSTLSGEVITISGDVQTLNEKVETISGSAITSGEVVTLINDATSGKTIDYLSAGTNVQINNNVISATDTKYTAGESINIDENKIISLKVPIWRANNQSTSVKENDTSNVVLAAYSHAEGYHTKANGNQSHAEGSSSVASGSVSHAEGEGTIANGNYSHSEGHLCVANGEASHAGGYSTRTNNRGEFASGNFNVSNSGSTTSAKTLFSVGNGTADDARHNAFEIKQNGDIYITSGSSDIKLQDHLGGGGSGGVTPTEVQTMIDNSLVGYQEELTAGTGIDITNNVISVTGGSQPVDAYTKAESDAKYATITNFNSHSGNTTVHITSAERTSWNAKPNVWCGNESEWSQISGSTQSGTIYLVY